MLTQIKQDDQIKLIDFDKRMLTKNKLLLINYNFISLLLTEYRK